MWQVRAVEVIFLSVQCEERVQSQINTQYNCQRVIKHKKSEPDDHDTDPEESSVHSTDQLWTIDLDLNRIWILSGKK